MERPNLGRITRAFVRRFEKPAGTANPSHVEQHDDREVSLPSNPSIMQIGTPESREAEAEFLRHDADAYPGRKTFES